MIRYPALFEDATKDIHSISPTKPFTVGRGVQADLPVTDGPCAPRQFRIVRERDGCYLEPLSMATPTLCDNQPVTSRRRLDHDAEIRVGTNLFRFVEFDPADPPRRSPPASPPKIEAESVVSSEPPIFETIPSRRPSRESPVVRKPSPPAVTSPLSYPLVRRLNIGRDESSVQILLRHPNVSRLHARIDSNQGKVVITDLGSANGTFLNGERVSGSTPIHKGDRIDIGPFGLVFDGKAVVPDSRVDNLELVGRDLHHSVNNPDGNPLILLNRISLVIRPHEFVCILGPSGSGKSTLLSVLSARRRCDEGHVMVNGADLHANFDSLKRDIAVVPQRDLLHELLTVEEALRYTACLRLPPDTTEAETQAQVDQILATVGLIEVRTKPIRLLSGGQSKRASLANEILSKPSLLFLDEVTSGLDEQTDTEIMSLFREVADSGKTVVCVTHTTANIERTCHLVIILASGGNLAFLGSPAEALAYFAVDRVGDIYERLAGRDPGEWHRRFLNSPAYARYVIGRLPPGHDSTSASHPTRKPGLGLVLNRFQHQTRILTARYVRVILRDHSTLLTMLLQSLTVAALLILLFRDEPGSTRSLLFLLSVASIWFGCNNSAKEFVKERTVFSRERNVNLFITSYYLSKFMVLACLSVVQTSLLLGLVRFFLTIDRGSTLSQEWTVLSALAVAGVALGLLISAWSRSEDQAVAAVPIVLLPQLILGGGIATLRDGTLVQWLARGFVTTYWGFDAISVDTTGPLTGHENQSISWMMLSSHLFVMAILAMILLDRRSTDGQSRRRPGG